MPPVHSKRLPCRIIYSGGLSGQRRNSPCEYACPAGTAIQSAHFLLAEGRTDEALSFLLSRNPFPGITGRVCPHFCENACNRAEHDEAVAIRALERKDADIPIIAMTADAFSEDIQKCLECGMNDHLAKPIDIQVVAHKITKYVK